MKTGIQLMVGLALVALTGCEAHHSGGYDTPAGLSANDRGAIEDSVAAFADACNAKAWDRVGALYAEDAVLLPPNTPMQSGRRAIGEFFANFPPFENLELTLDEVEGTGDLAWVRGSYSMTLVMEGADPFPDSGGFLEIRRKNADGKWLIYRDMFVSAQPAAGH